MSYSPGLLRFIVMAFTAFASSAGAEPVDNCASLLGSLSVELRHARNLPAGARTTFTCPRDTRAILGADRQRVVNSLGPPDSTSPGAGRDGLEWTYRFTGKFTDPAASPGFPQVVFVFDARQQVVAVNCGRSP